MTIYFSVAQRMRWMCSGLVLVVLAWGASLAEDRRDQDGPANAATQRVHEEARRILKNIRESRYQHRSNIDEEQGVYRCDCSGLGLYILNRTVAMGDAGGPLGDGRRRPRAVDFHDVFAKAETHANGGGRWQRVERLMDARPGDIIAWRREKILPGKVTGHVVIVDEKPVQEEDGLVRVVMIDSTTKAQFNDTRTNGANGIGRGTMWFTVDEAGRPVGYVRGGKRDAEPKVERISIGRALPGDEHEAEQRKAA